MKLTNHFLVAMPTIRDEIFYGSVIYVTEHDVANGAVGVVINKPLGKTLKNAFKDLDLREFNPAWENSPLYLGGPISADNGFVLHRSCKNSEQLFELTNNRSVLGDIASSKYKDELFVSIGYTAWAGFQLEHEIMSNDWLVVKADPGLIFDVDPLNRYNEALRLLGVQDPSHLYYSSEVNA